MNVTVQALHAIHSDKSSKYKGLIADWATMDGDFDDDGEDNTGGDSVGTIDPASGVHDLAGVADHTEAAEAEPGAKEVGSSCAKPSARRTLAVPKTASAFANVSLAYGRRPPPSPSSQHVMALPQISILNRVSSKTSHTKK